MLVSSKLDIYHNDIYQTDTLHSAYFTSHHIRGTYIIMTLNPHKIYTLLQNIYVSIHTYINWNQMNIGYFKGLDLILAP